MPVSLLAIAALGPDPAARYGAFLKAHPAFVATLEVASSGKGNAKETLRVAHPHRLRFDVKAEGLDYAVSSTEGAYIEVDRIAKTYDERPTIGGFVMYESRFSSAPSLLPNFLLGELAFGGGKAKVKPVEGGDELSATVQTQSGAVNLRLVVDPQGKPIRFSQSGAARPLEWRLTSFADAKPDLAPFLISRPLGYVTYALADLPTPLAVGQAAPLTGWRRRGQAVDLGAASRGRPRLLAVLGADSPPSRSARPFLIDLGKSMPVCLIGPGEITDPSGGRMKRLSPPGTPMFYLVGGDGKVKNLWFGFDPAKGKAWEDEVRAAAQGPAK